MKYIPSALLTLCLLAGLTACAGTPAEQAPEETAWTVRQMAASIWEAGSSLGGTELLPGDDLYDTYVAGSYGLDAAEIADGAIWAAGGTSAQETAVFQTAEEADPEAVAELLRTYLENRIGAFTGYLPEEAALLEDAQVLTRGGYVALLACEDMDAAQSAFDQCFTEDPPVQEETDRPWAEPPQPEDTEESTPETPPAEAPASSISEQPAEERPKGNQPAGEPESPAAPSQEVPDRPIVETQEQEAQDVFPQPSQEPSAPQPEPEPEPWAYDERRLLSAWAAGDWSELAAEDQAILDICREVIDTVVPADGTDYDRELAVHDWMIAHGRYDNNTLSQLPNFQENPNNDNPYGFLVDGVGICLGYTRTFQLFMDLLGIECITVEGAAYNNTADHAWNQVLLDGEWYCVDVTWDDPTTSGTVSQRSAHRFFNVTSQHMRDTSHQWDEAAVPEATGTAWAWQ